jgi:S1-C subfamily serine protease
MKDKDEEQVLKIEVERDKKNTAEKTVTHKSDALTVDFSDSREKDSTISLSRDELISPNLVDQIIGRLSAPKILRVFVFVTILTCLSIAYILIVNSALKPQQNVQVRSISGNNPQNLESLVASVKPAIVLIRSSYARDKVAEGTGFIISPNGYMLTAEHVIHGLATVDVWLQNGKRYKAGLISSDKTHDLALLKLKHNRSFPYITLADSNAVRSGMETVIFGYPLGSGLGIAPTVTPSIVSALRNGRTQIQISAAVNPGNSGGPLINRYNGEVIGVVTAKHNNADGIAFAVPSQIVKRLKDYNQIIRQ